MLTEMLFHTNVYFDETRVIMSHCGTETCLSKKQGSAFFVFCYGTCLMLTEMLSQTWCLLTYLGRRVCNFCQQCSQCSC